MHSETTLAVVINLVTMVAATPYWKDCVFNDLDFDDALTSVITQLSKYEEYIQADIRSYRGLLDIECCNVSGLGHLRQYGPLLPYCVNSTRKLQVDLFNHGPIEVIMKWRTYTAKEGTLVLGAQLSRFTLQFEIVELPSGNSIALRLQEPVVPVATEMTYAVVRNVGEIARVATAFWSELLPSVTERVWKSYFFEHLRWAIGHAQRDLFNPLVLTTTKTTDTA